MRTVRWCWTTVNRRVLLPGRTFWVFSPDADGGFGDTFTGCRWRVAIDPLAWPGLTRNRDPNKGAGNSDERSAAARRTEPRRPTTGGPRPGWPGPQRRRDAGGAERRTAPGVPARRRDPGRH